MLYNEQCGNEYGFHVPSHVIRQSTHVTLALYNNVWAKLKIVQPNLPLFCQMTYHTLTLILYIVMCMQCSWPPLGFGSLLARVGLLFVLGPPSASFCSWPPWGHGWVSAWWEPFTHPPVWVKIPVMYMHLLNGAPWNRSSWQSMTGTVVASL